MREVWLRTLLVLVSLVLGLALAEVGVRMALAFGEGPAEDPEAALERSRDASLAADGEDLSLKGLVRPSPWDDVVYSLKPSLRGSFRGRPLATNAHGLRGPETPLAKPPGTVRIVGLGDSVMFGWGVGEGETYLELLATRLNAAAGDGRRYEPLSFAVPGYNTAMEVATFEHVALPFEPDVVLLHFVDNDLRLPHFLLAPRNLLALDRSYLFDLLAARLGAAMASPETRLLDHDLGELDDDAKELARSRYRHLAGPDGFRRAMARLAELTRPRGIPVLVIRLGRGQHARLVEAAIAEHGFHEVLAAPAFLAEFARLGLPVDEESWTRTFWVSASDHHPNARGHEVYAEVVADALAPLVAPRP